MKKLTKCCYNHSEEGFNDNKDFIKNSKSFNISSITYYTVYFYCFMYIFILFIFIKYFCND